MIELVTGREGKEAVELVTRSDKEAVELVTGRAD